MRIDRRRISGVYLLTPDSDAAQFDQVIDIVEQAIDAGVRLIQYRDKAAAINGQYAVQFERTQRLLELTRRADALLIVNDLIDLASRSNADGVHLGREDGDLAAARHALPNSLVGVSCYNEMARAQQAVADGADAIAFGSVFASSTKPNAVRAPLSLLTEARDRWPEHRVVAIGGINAGNIATVAVAGAHAAAVIDAVFAAKKPAAAARELVVRFEEGRRRHDEQRTTV